MPISRARRVWTTPSNDQRELDSRKAGMMKNSNIERASSQPWVRGVFLAMLAFNLWAVSVGWRNINLPGCEFRQAQTAISALFIQRDHDFSLAYPTPVLGKPWSIPMEFPLYQWTVVATSNLTGISLVTAGRTISALCFYLTLPALSLLLRQFGYDTITRRIALCLMLTCPLYIFYARAFLIETMALMFGAWYFYGLVRAVTERDVRWLTGCAVAGTAAGLVKVTTFMGFAAAAALWAAMWLWKERPKAGQRDSRLLRRRLGWLLAANAVPGLAVLWWLHFSDAVKLLNPSGQMLTSANLADWNFGIGQRVSPRLWQAHASIVFREIVSPFAVLVAALAVPLGSRQRSVAALACLGFFVGVQFVFPVLYAWHEYYYVASAFAAVLALALVLSAPLESKGVRRSAGWVLMVAVLAVQITTWYRLHWREQATTGAGGSGLTAALEYVTSPGDVLVVAGDDWNSMIPYYSERRALMIRDDVLREASRLDDALRLMQGESVGALVLRGNQRENVKLLEQMAATFGIERRPALFWQDATVYLTSRLRSEALEALARRKFQDVLPGPAEIADKGNGLAARELRYAELSPHQQALFRSIQPAPVRFFTSMGPDTWEANGELRFYAHPDTRLDFALTPGSHRLRTRIGLVAAAYTEGPPEGQSDGVTFAIVVRYSDGHREKLREQDINPRDHESDRGDVSIDWAFVLPSAAELEIAISAGPNGNNMKDWATLAPIVIE
jgi:hypothetical protein